MVATIKSLMKNELLFLSGNDIPFAEGSITIHQPTMKEIAFLGEEAFFTGCELLKFSKNILVIEDNLELENMHDFDILMSIMNDKSAQTQLNVSCALMVLDLLFPLYEIAILPQGIFCIPRDGEGIICGGITKNNFDAFKQIIISMFCLEKTQSETYNVQGELAKKIAEKFKKRNQKLAELQQKPNKVAIFSRYISILTVGEHKDINSFMNYTVYQLFDEFQRFELKENYDVYVKAKLAGAKDMKEPDSWMKDIHA